MEKELYEFTRNYLITSHCEICSTIIVSLFIHFLRMYLSFAFLREKVYVSEPLHETY
jgi:hypothetical protein